MVAVAIAGLITVMYFWVRREWIFRVRLQLVLDQIDMKDLPTFNEMLFGMWWVWTVDGLTK